LWKGFRDKLSVRLFTTMDKEAEKTATNTNTNKHTHIHTHTRKLGGLSKEIGKPWILANHEFAKDFGNFERSKGNRWFSK
jgi:hypothetical protein